MCVWHLFTSFPPPHLCVPFFGFCALPTKLRWANSGSSSALPPQAPAVRQPPRASAARWGPVVSSYCHQRPNKCWMQSMGHHPPEGIGCKMVRGYIYICLRMSVGWNLAIYSSWPVHCDEPRGWQPYALTERVTWHDSFLMFLGYRNIGWPVIILELLFMDYDLNVGWGLHVTCNDVNKLWLYWTGRSTITKLRPGSTGFRNSCNWKCRLRALGSELRLQQLPAYIQQRLFGGELASVQCVVWIQGWVEWPGGPEVKCLSQTDIRSLSEMTGH